VSRLRARLDRLLRLRTHELDRSRRELEQACETCEAANRRMAKALEQARELDAELGRELEQGLPGLSVRAGGGAGAASHDAARTASDGHTRAADQEATARERVVEALKRVRGLEILKSRRQRTESRDAERRRQHELDEIGQQQWRRHER